MTEVTPKKRKSLPDADKTAKKTKSSTADTPKLKGNLKSANEKSTKAQDVSKAPSKPQVKNTTVKSTSKPTKKATPATTTAEDFAGFSDSDDEPAQMTAAQSAMLAGFSSSDSDTETESASAITKIPSLPASASLDKQLSAAKTAAASDPESTPGTIYIGRIPHGFYEPQMQAYFGQFGTISRLRLSRNKHTGKSKHYAFVEFESAAVADIVARTMDKYLLFGHILQVKMLRDEEVHPELWKGAGRRFKAMPRARMQGSLLARGRGREGWEKRVRKEERRRRVKGEILKEMGYEFEMPEVKQVDSVPKRVEDVKVGEVEEEAKEAAESHNKEDESVEPVVLEEKAEVAETPDSAAAKRKKGRKEKKVTKKVRLST